MQLVYQFPYRWLFKASGNAKVTVKTPRQDTNKGECCTKRAGRWEKFTQAYFKNVTYKQVVDSHVNLWQKIYSIPERPSKND